MEETLMQLRYTALIIGIRVGETHMIDCLTLKRGIFLYFIG